MKVKMVLFLIFVIFLIIAGYFFIGSAPKQKDILFGVNFSPKHAQNLGLDWKETYLAILDDLKVKDLKLITHWDWIEGEKDKFYFDDLDWKIREAEKRNVNIILIIGMKTGRWPECHLPEWAKNLTKKEQEERVLKLVEEIVLRYKNEKSIIMWGVENEPFFPFGECLWSDEDFVKKEIHLVKSLDSKRQILFSDSGEGSFWIKAAKLGDLVGITMYKRAWFEQLNTYVYYPLPPVFYWRKALLIKKIFNKDVMVVELQGEPWGPKLLYDTSLAEQEKTMDLEKLKYNIDFAKRTGFNEFYLWGSEWWYWMKTKQGRPEIWSEVQKLFQ